MDYKDLNLIGSSSPHIRTRYGTGHIMGEVLVALLPALGFAIYNFGIRALATTLVSVVGCCFFEWVYRAMMGKNNTIEDMSAVVTGVLIAFVCPVTIPYWILLVGDFFAIVIVKQLFGGVGKNFLNPALAARAFMLSWAGEMTTWVGPRVSVPLEGVVDAVTYPTPMALLHENNLEGLMQMYDLPDMLVGFIGGSIGEVSALLLILGGVYLIFRKIITWYIPLSYIGTVALLTFLFPMGNDPLTWMLYQVLGGGLLLGAFFMATDYVTSPVSHRGQVIFGVGFALVLPLWFGLDGVLYSMPVSDLLTFLVAMFLIAGTYKELNKKGALAQ